MGAPHKVGLAFLCLKAESPHGIGQPLPRGDDCLAVGGQPLLIVDGSSSGSDGERVAVAR